MTAWRGQPGWRGAARDRTVAALASALVVTLLGYALLVGLGVRIAPRTETPLVALDIRPPPPPPKRPHPKPRTARPSGAAAPAGARHPRVRPLPQIAPPPIVIPPAPKIVASAPTGASTGPGSGAGGRGRGTGSGDEGDGDGGGETPPERIRGALDIADLPRDLRDIGGRWTVEVRYYVNVDGRVSGCTVTHGSGSAELDGETCRLIEKRFRYAPSRDADGRPVRSIIGEEHHLWDFDRDD